MKLLWTWVQSAKWPLKMTRKQANRRLFREQWPRRRYKVRRVREFYEPREHLSEEYSLLSSEETLRGVVFQRHDHSEGTGQPNKKEGRKFLDFLVWWVLLAQPSFMPTCTCCSASMAPNSTQTWPLSPLDLVSLSIFFFSVGFLSQRLVQAIFQLAFYPRG